MSRSMRQSIEATKRIAKKVVDAHGSYPEDKTAADLVIKRLDLILENEKTYAGIARGLGKALAISTRWDEYDPSAPAARLSGALVIALAKAIEAMNFETACSKAKVVNERVCPKCMASFPEGDTVCPECEIRTSGLPREGSLS